METKTKIIIISACVLGVIAAVVVAAAFSFVPQKDYTDFAKCIKDKGFTFYGAWWCPHCEDEKHLFGNAAQYLPYVECSTADGAGQTQICKDKNIKNYPTWVLPDGTISEGEMTLQELADKSGCQLPK